MMTSLVASLLHFARLVVQVDASMQGVVRDSGIRRYHACLTAQRSTPFAVLARIMCLMSYGAYGEDVMPVWVWNQSNVLLMGWWK